MRFAINCVLDLKSAPYPIPQVLPNGDVLIKLKKSLCLKNKYFFMKKFLKGGGGRS